MTDDVQTPQPNPQTIIQIQQETINNLNSNQVFLQALLKDTRDEALQEISKLMEQVSKLKSKLTELDPKWEDADLPID